MTTSDTGRIPRGDEHVSQRKGIELEIGDEVVFNDRSRALTVVGRHERQRTNNIWSYRNEAKYNSIIRLEGNGTEYHLLCTGGSPHGPMLYKKSEWDDEPDKLGNKPKYSRMGERVESMRVVSE